MIRKRTEVLAANGDDSAPDAGAYTWAEAQDTVRLVKRKVGGGEEILLTVER